MERAISFTLNGKPTRVTVDDERMLLWVLRSDLVHLRSRRRLALPNAECICEELVSSGRKRKGELGLAGWSDGRACCGHGGLRRHHRRLWLACHLLVVRRTQHGQHSVCLVFHHRSTPTK